MSLSITSLDMGTIDNKHLTLNKKSNDCKKITSQIILRLHYYIYYFISIQKNRYLFILTIISVLVTHNFHIKLNR